MTGKIRLESARGITVVELLVGVLLLGAVLSAAWSLYCYGFTSFTRAQEQMENQQTVRLVAKVITDEIRKAEEIGFKDKKELGYECIYVDNGGEYILQRAVKRVVKREADGRTTIIAEVPENAKIGLNFELIHDTRNIVDFTVKIISEKGEYEMESSVFGLNLPERHTLALNPDNGAVLYYRTQPREIIMH